jgi:transcription elongation factor Elf1
MKKQKVIVVEEKQANEKILICSQCKKDMKPKTIVEKEPNVLALCKVCGVEYDKKKLKQHKTTDRHMNVSKIVENLLKLPDNLLVNLKNVCDKSANKQDNSINVTVQNMQ